MALIVSLGAVVSMPPAVARAAAGDTVVTQDGPVSGTSVSGMRAFLGIPYAAPPVGPLRWHPPEPHVRWSAPRDATRFANHCPQPAGYFGKATDTEDCLYLNVFTPPGAAARSSLPVMVWIHGGAFTTGESDDYNPVRFVGRNVVAVTLNYRLGRFGFFAQTALDNEHHYKVNYGLMDQQRALRWVQGNIRQFGGDPSRVTIFGESAGGLSVTSQLTSPKAAGLFGGAIVESGDYQLTLPTLQASEQQGNAVAALIGCPNQTASCLRSLTAKQILGSQSSAESAGVVPTVDGDILQQSPSTAFATGQFNRVPVINGSNHDEWRLFAALYFDLSSGPLTATAYPGAIAALVGPAAAPLVVKEYPVSRYPSPDLAYAAAGTDAIFACTAYGADLSLTKYVPTYAYEFADENAPQPYLPRVSFPYAAAHASEIQYLFESFKGDPPLTAAQRQLSQKMVGLWTGFAAHRAAWQSFGRGLGDELTLVPPQPIMTSGASFAGYHKCAFWAALAAGGAARAK